MINLNQSRRHLFPVLQQVTYLNSCSQGALAIPVRGALDGYLDGMYERGSLWDEWVLKQQELRGLVAEVFCTTVSNVAITSSASAGINSVLSSFDFSGSKNRIITTDLEFPTMGQILHAHERRGAQVTHVASEPHGLVDMDKFEASLDERVALIAVTHVCYRNGAMIDLKAIASIAQRYGIPVLVDAYQSSGSLPINFDEMEVDFLVGGFLKYMLGIPGIGFLLARSGSSLVPTKTGWFAARDIFAMDINRYDPSSEARRFEEGTPPIPSVYAAIAGLRILLEVGLDRAWESTLGIHNAIRDGIEGLGLQTVTPKEQRSHGAMLAIAARDEFQAVSALESSGVITSSRAGNLRISPHFYNDETDVDALVGSIRANQNLFC